MSGAERIARRYFIVNGFDGALTMLGLLTGFIVSAIEDLDIVISACLGVAIALGVSGVSSAYVSESAERKHDLDQLEGAMVTNLEDSYHGSVARWMPILIALANGLAPLSISLLVLAPIWLANSGVVLPFAPLYVAMGIALLCVFLLGVFLGRIEGVSWLRSGIRTLLIALATAALILLIAGN